MRFGFKTSPQDTTWDAMLDVWRAADDIAVFESGWTSDHFYSLHGADTAGPRFEGWMTLAALAQATRRLRMGTLVTAIGYRHPAVLANMAATLDVVSGGRLELGVAPSCRCSDAGHMTIREVMVRSSAGQRSAQRAGLSWGAVADRRAAFMREDLTWSMRALVAANVWAALVLLAAIGVGAHDGFGSGVVFIGSTPIVLCGVCSALYAVGKKRDLRAPVILAIALCALGALTALVSFIGPLVVAVIPASALLIAACVPLLLRAYGITAT